MRKLQEQRHLYDIKLMVLNNPLFKNLTERDQKKLIKLIYKAEMMEVFMRDRQIMRVNHSFDDIVESVANMLDDALNQDDGDDFDDPDRRKDF